MIPQAILSRISLLRYGGIVGSSFTIERGGSQHFITARHLFVADPGKPALPVAINHG